MQIRILVWTKIKKKNTCGKTRERKFVQLKFIGSRNSDLVFKAVVLKFRIHIKVNVPVYSTLDVLLYNKLSQTQTHELILTNAIVHF